MRLVEIARNYDLKLISLTESNFLKNGEKFGIIKSEAKNNAYLLNDYIILGFYDDKEIKRASFFHEIGHSLISESFEKLVNNDILLIEYEAWVLGLREAKKYGMTFSNNVFEYIHKSLNTYYSTAISVYTKNS